MKDLTQGSIPRHVVALAIPMMAGMLLQTLYFFVDLYFVAGLGDAAIAGVSAAGNLMFVVFFLTQMLGVGTVAMVSHAVGRKNREEANFVFNQAVVIAGLFTAVTLIGGYLLIEPYMRFFAAEDAVHDAGTAFLAWFIPSMALQFPIVVLASALRGTGIVKPAMAVQAISVLLNTALAPVLIAGWGTGRPLGVTGAGLASFLATAVGTVLMLVYFVRLEHYVRIDSAQWRPQLATWGRLFNIGLPAGGEFGLMALFVGIMYWAARDFGTAAQGGLGVGFRINQMVMVPALAVTFGAAAIAGQNYGAALWERVRKTFFATLVDCVALMVLLALFVQWKADAMVRIFTADREVIANAVDFLTYLSWNFIPAGVAFSCSSIFQGMGNTWPSFASSAIRILTFALPGIWMARQPWFDMRDIYMLSVATVFLQAVVACVWLKREFDRRLR